MKKLIIAIVLLSGCGLTDQYSVPVPETDRTDEVLKAIQGLRSDGAGNGVPAGVGGSAAAPSGAVNNFQDGTPPQVLPTMLVWSLPFGCSPCDQFERENSSTIGQGYVRCEFGRIPVVLNKIPANHPKWIRDTLATPGNREGYPFFEVTFPGGDWRRFSGYSGPGPLMDWYRSGLQAAARRLQSAYSGDRSIISFASYNTSSSGSSCNGYSSGSGNCGCSTTGVCTCGANCNCVGCTCGNSQMRTSFGWPNGSYGSSYATSYLSPVVTSRSFYSSPVVSYSYSSPVVTSYSSGYQVASANVTPGVVKSVDSFGNTYVTRAPGAYNRKVAKHIQRGVRLGLE